LVDIGPVVSEEKIFLNFISLFLFLAWRTSWLEVGITRHIFGSLLGIGPVVYEEKIVM
jgi:hypothetical protein